MRLGNYGTSRELSGLRSIDVVIVEPIRRANLGAMGLAGFDGPAS